MHAVHDSGALLQLSILILTSGERRLVDGDGAHVEGPFFA
jgi:hypothetical protein